MIEERLDIVTITYSSSCGASEPNYLGAVNRTVN